MSGMMLRPEPGPRPTWVGWVLIGSFTLMLGLIIVGAATTIRFDNECHRRGGTVKQHIEGRTGERLCLVDGKVVGRL